MKKHILLAILGLGLMLLLLVACDTSSANHGDFSDSLAYTESMTESAIPEATQAESVTQTETELETELETEPETEPATEPVTELETEPVTEPVTELETESPYLIPDPTIIDFSTFSQELLSATFSGGGRLINVTQTSQGVLFVAQRESRDPSLMWRISSMYEAAGYPLSEDGKTHVPFTPEEKKVIVLKIQAQWGGAFEMFYATEDRTSAQSGYSLTTVYGGDSEFFGERVSQYLILEADGTTPGWKTRFNNSFRLDYTNFVGPDDEFLLEKIGFFADRAEAEAYIAADKGEPAPIPLVEKGYYICLYEDRLHLPEDNVLGGAVSSLDSAIQKCDRSKQYGYRVANEKGEVVYTPYTLLQCNLLREAKFVTQYAKDENFKYGDSCTNPGINHRPHFSSCDRLVDWILYRAGFTDQPWSQGKVVPHIPEWCEKMGFEKITRVEDLQPGDIVFVHPGSTGDPLHVYMVASTVSRGNALRYDHGSDSRIMSNQPTSEPVSYGDAPFMYAYRPVVTEENNIYYNELYANADKQP